ncbi:MAG: lactonase family protein [Bryobacteraceae bacterium]
MESKKERELHAQQSPFSRREMLRGLPALAAAAATTVGTAQAQTGQIIAYVGAYTNRARGIHSYFVNPSDGTLTAGNVLTGLPNPSSLAVHPNKKYIYAINEIGNFAGSTNGSVTSISVDAGTGDLKIMNVVSSQGAGPAHVSVDPSGKWVFAANYGGGSAAVLPILPDGSLGAAADVARISGPLGRQPADDAPPGSFAISGHDAPHAHMAQTDLAGNYLFVADLGTDRIYIYKFDKVTGKLTPNDQPFLQASSGAGPRHFDFHPNGRWAYAITEEASTMLYLTYDASKGSLEIKQSASTLPETFTGTNFPSAVMLSADGRFLYGANRLYDSVVIFAINAEGWMIRAGDEWTRGSYPRDIAIEPNGNFMYVLHSRSDNVTSFQVDKNTGLLSFTGQFLPLGNPSRMVFLTL